MTAAERARVEELLQDQSLSYRAISRATGVSDWSIRRLARLLDGDERPMRQRHSRSQEPPTEEVSPILGWLVFGGFILGTAFLIWIGARSAPPPQPPDSFTSLYPPSPTEGRQNETQYPE